MYQSKQYLKVAIEYLKKEKGGQNKNFGLFLGNCDFPQWRRSFLGRFVCSTTNCQYHVSVIMHREMFQKKKKQVNGPIHTIGSVRTLRLALGGRKMDVFLCF